VLKNESEFFFFRPSAPIGWNLARIFINGPDLCEAISFLPDNLPSEKNL
jgi:hypothetical protein